NVLRILEENKYVQGEHWLFFGHKDGKGYGYIRFNGKQYIVSRLSAYAYFDFDLNSSLLILHKLTCPYRACFNPDCLYIGDYIDNARDTVKLGTHRNTRKTH